MSKWTPEQEAAIVAGGASLFVSAAAGSGKTSVLVERLIRILADAEHPMPAEQMIVVTFTNDAAAEVRSRLHTSLTAKLAQDSENAWLRRQQSMLAGAKISTIHKFCMELVREHCEQFDRLASFRVMEENEEKAMRAQAAEQALELWNQRIAEGDADAKTKLDCLLAAFCPKDDTELIDLMQTVYGRMEEIPFGETLLPEWAEACEQGGMVAKAKQELQYPLEDCCMLYRRAILLAQAMESPNVALLQTELGYAEGIWKAVCDADWATAANIIQTEKFGKFFSKNKKNFPNDYNMSKALREHGKSILESLKGWCLPLQYAKVDLARHSAVFRALDGLVSLYAEQYERKKQERNVITFNDALRFALHLLAEHTEGGSIRKTKLAEELSEQYGCIMIDEFQDADALQDLIFRLLSKSGDSSRYGSNLFIVGDSKQCIYRFRHANPTLFTKAMQEGAPYKAPQLTENTGLFLNKNFRSTERVIAFVNVVFRQLMCERVGEQRYDRTQELVQGAQYTPNPGKVEMMIIQKQGNSRPDVAGEIAKRIQWHLQHGTIVFDKSIGEERSCQPKDFLILFRKNGRMANCVEALRSHQIPVGSVEEEGYLKSPEITLLLDILRAIDNPTLDISVSATLLSPMFGMTLDELAELRLRCPKSNFSHAVWMLTDQVEKQGGAATPLSEKCSRFLAFMNEMRLYASMETSEQLIRRIYHRTDFLGMMQMTGNGAQKKANLRALIVHAKTFEENYGGGLHAFLRYLDSILERGADLGCNGVPAGTENVVQLKTIHKSKGLEAPFVILAEPDWTKGERGAPPAKRYHEDMGFGFRLLDHEQLSINETLPWKTIAACNRREEQSEEMRLLYVALTRARENLIVPVVVNKTLLQTVKNYAFEQMAFGGQTPTLTASANSMQEWLLMAIIRNISVENLRKALDCECDGDADQAQIWVDVITETENPKAEETVQAQEVKPKANADLLARLQRQIAWHYDSPLANLTAKYGVSELTHEEFHEMPLRRPAFMKDRRKLTGSERGSAVHTFMQYADYAAAARDLNGEIARLEGCNRLTARQAEAVRESEIGTFFVSPLYVRIAASKQVMREQKFTVRIADLALSGKLEELGKRYAGTEGMLIGIMDLVFAEEDGLVLVDYKTDHVKTADELVELYALQVQLYANALRRILKMPVKACYLYSVTCGESVEIAVS